MNAPRIINFGCRLNAYESEAMAEHVRTAGLTDTVVINTCAVTAEAVRQARQAVRKARRDRSTSRIVVTGCAAQTDPETFAAMGEVDHRDRQRCEDAARDLRRARAASPASASSSTTSCRSRETAHHLVDGFGGRARAYVQIQNGCDHRCTFCIIPFGRGQFALGAGGRGGRAGPAPGRARLSRGGADRRRHHGLWRATCPAS